MSDYREQYPLYLITLEEGERTVCQCGWEAPVTYRVDLDAIYRTAVHHLAAWCPLRAEAVIADALDKVSAEPKHTLEAVCERFGIDPDEVRRRAREARLEAVQRISGSYTGLYEPGYLDNLRAEWPDEVWDELPSDAVGDWLIETEHGTRFYLVTFPREGRFWWRVPGSPESSRSYADRPYRLVSLWGRRYGAPVRVGDPFTIGQGSLSDDDLWRASRVVSIRRLTDDDPPA